MLYQLSYRPAEWQRPDRSTPGRARQGASFQTIDSPEWQRRDGSRSCSLRCPSATLDAQDMPRPSTRRLPLSPAGALLPDPLVDPATLGPNLDLAGLFGDPAATGPKAREVEIEVGAGKGRFLLEQATARPDTLFLAVERSQPYLRLVGNRVLAGALPNVRLLRIDARELFGRLLAPASVHAVHILFPDPWPKRRQHKRRLLDTPFLTDVARALVPGGILNIASDHSEYGEAIASAAAPVRDLIAEPTFRLGDLGGRTHFAVRFADQAASFFTRSWRRRT